MSAAPITTVSTVRRRLVLTAGLTFALWAAWQVSQDEPAANVQLVEQRSPTTRRVPAKPLAAASVPALVWPTQGSQVVSMGDLFSPVVVPVTKPPAPPPVAPPGPVFTYKYVGRLDDGVNSHAFLSSAQDQMVVVKAGQPVDSEWQLSTIGSQQLVFRHIATGQEHTLQIGTLQ